MTIKYVSEVHHKKREENVCALTHAHTYTQRNAYWTRKNIKAN